MDASQNYTQNQVLGLEQTELESRALIRTASALNAIMENWDERKSELDEALEKNRKLWTILASAMGEADCPQPEEGQKKHSELGNVYFPKNCGDFD